MQIKITLTASILFLGTLSFASGPSSQDYSIVRQSFSSGGRSCVSTHYASRSTFGQAGPIGSQGSTDYMNHGGYWYSEDIIPTPTPAGSVTATPFFTSTPTVVASATITPTVSATEHPTFTPTPATPSNTPTPENTTIPTVTPSGSPQNTSTPTPVNTTQATNTPPPPTNSPTPAECTQTGVTLWMPSHDFGPNDLCSCSATVCNAEGSDLESYPLFVILDVFGSYFFAPSFNQTFDNYLDLHQLWDIGETQILVLPEFMWPAGVGSASGIKWYAALTNPQMTQLFGGMGSWEFGWHE